MPRKKRERIEKHKQSLGDVLEDPETYGVRTKPRSSKKKHRHEEREEEDQMLPPELTGKIMKEAQLQQREVTKDEEMKDDVRVRETLAGAIKSLKGHVSASDDDEGWSEPESDFDPEDWEAEIDAEDEAVLSAFMTNHAGDQKQKTLADIIMEKIKEKEENGTVFPDEMRDGKAGEPSFIAPPQMDHKVIEVYRGVGQLMSRYTSGKVPKAFKVIPNLKNWEEVLYLTEPEFWSPHAVYQATRMFVSNLNSRMAQRFLALVLLPHVRNDIQNNKRLHFALFQALKKATFKAGAFYKGILLPLCSSGNCTLREAVIITSVLRRSSIPVLHSAAAVLRIAEMPYSGVNSFFIRVILDKRYALPYRVIDSLVDHFTSFAKEERQLPVVWHQALLCFVQRYKAEIRREDKESLRALCKVQYHYKMTPEVLRELDSSKSRGEKETDAMHVEGASVFFGGIKGQENPNDLAPMIMLDD